MREYRIEIKDLSIKDIHSIDFVLENMEGITLYKSEILDIKLEYADTLGMDGKGIVRAITNGYIKVDINDKLKRYEGDVIIYNEKGREIKKPSKEVIQNRLMSCCNICYITVTYEDNYWKENIEVPFEMDDSYNYPVCPSAELDKDGKLLILFGKMSKANDSCSSDISN